MAGKIGIHKGSRKERELTGGGKLYFPEIIKGLFYSFKQLLRPTYTLNYPEVKPDLGPEFRGRPVLVKETLVD